MQLSPLILTATSRSRDWFMPGSQMKKLRSERFQWLAKEHTTCSAWHSHRVHLPPTAEQECAITSEARAQGGQWRDRPCQPGQGHCRKAISGQALEMNPEHVTLSKRASYNTPHIG